MKDIWIIDSDAFCHMTYQRKWLTDYESVKVVSEVVSLGDDKQCSVNGKGTVIIKKLIKGRWYNGRIENVLFVSH